ncbi:RNase adapter RapZ [Celeribacter baekdonensis]|uniref:RNase adapter RapZ n=1 Tax=Celeribacter baekdonensis TaxID=875171 RepID=A0A2R4M525_9RHOB|nr:RNase adapter RapZ [Celeribacter baekdonensis]AVW92246.1 RNase adapter RapZ [Celeribacter baekdonensis]
MSSQDSPLPQSKSQRRVVLITGPSGAGRSTAINALEDLGYEVIDNLPMSILPRLLQAHGLTRPLALGLDVRNRDFSVNALIEVIDELTRNPDHDAEVLYLDSSPEVLIRRYSETRRRHPLAPAETVQDGVAREIDLLAPIRARADILIDTSGMTPHQLRDEIERWFAEGTQADMALTIQSFSYKRGMPRGVDMVFDVRFLANPYWEPALRALNGTDPKVQEYVQRDPRFAAFFGKVLELTLLLLPAYREEGKKHLSIAFGCTGGQHRSVTLAEILSKALAEHDWQVSIRHRELERRQSGL